MKKDIASLLLRLGMGAGFIVHGVAKISRGTAGFEKLLRLEGVPFAHVNAVIGPYVELIGGVALILGLYVTLTAIPLLFTMLVATVFVQGHYGFSSVKTLGLTPEGPVFGPPGWEINLLYMTGLAALMVLGEGRYGVRKIFRARGIAE